MTLNKLHKLMVSPLKMTLNKLQKPNGLLILLGLSNPVWKGACFWFFVYEMAYITWHLFHFMLVPLSIYTYISHQIFITSQDLSTLKQQQQKLSRFSQVKNTVDRNK